MADVVIQKFGDIQFGPLAPANQSCRILQAGVCDPYLTGRLDLTGIREDTALALLEFVPTSDGASPAPTFSAGGVDGDDLQVEPFVLNLFNTQNTPLESQIVQNGWFPKTGMTLYAKSGVVYRGRCFLIFGFAAAWAEVFMRGGTGTAQADPKMLPVALAPADDGPNYSRVITHELTQNTHMEVSMSEEGSVKQLPRLALTPSPASGYKIFDGIRPDFSYLPLNTCYLTSDAQALNAFTMNVVLNQALRFQNAKDLGPGIVTPAPSATGTNQTINEANNSAVYAQVYAQAIGAVVCCPIDKACALLPD